MNIFQEEEHIWLLDEYQIGKDLVHPEAKLYPNKQLPDQFASIQPLLSSFKKHPEHLTAVFGFAATTSGTLTDDRTRLYTFRNTFWQLLTCYSLETVLIVFDYGARCRRLLHDDGDEEKQEKQEQTKKEMNHQEEEEKVIKMQQGCLVHRGNFEGTLNSEQAMDFFHISSIRKLYGSSLRVRVQCGLHID